MSWRLLGTTLSTHGIAVNQFTVRWSVTSCAVHSVNNVYVYYVQFFDSGISLMASGNGARRVVQLTKAGMFLVPCANHAKCIVQLAEAGMCLVPFAYHAKWIVHFMGCIYCHVPIMQIAMYPQVYSAKCIV